MDRSHLIDQLARHEEVYRAFFKDLTPHEKTWKPATDKWCMQEILCHLYDEEREDFHRRLEHVLSTPEAPLPPSNPTEWMATRNYMAKDFNTELQRFLDERRHTVAWLRTLRNAAWNNVHQHPKVGPITPELFLTNWVAHDLHHLRQLINLRHAYLKSISTVPLDYAGTW